MTERTPIAVVYQLKNKMYIKEFTDLRCPDPLITNRSTKLPEGAEIIQIGKDQAFIKRLKRNTNYEILRFIKLSQGYQGHRIKH